MKKLFYMIIQILGAFVLLSGVFAEDLILVVSGGFICVMTQLNILIFETEKNK